MPIVRDGGLDPSASDSLIGNASHGRLHCRRRQGAHADCAIRQHVRLQVSERISRDRGLRESVTCDRYRIDPAKYDNVFED